MIKLRPCRDGDAGRLGDLWVAAWNATLPEIDFATRRDWFDAWLRDHLGAGGHVVVAMAEAQLPAGFVGVMPPSGPDGIGHMEQIAVHPAAFGSGVGALLLEAAKSLCPAGLTLRVNQENARAVAFYRRAGFVVTAAGVNPGGRRPVFDMAWRPPGAGAPAVTRPERP